MTSNFDGAVKFIPAIVGAAFCASVLHEWGFLYAFGLSLGDLFLSTGEITASAIVWIPKVLICFIFGSLLTNLLGWDDRTESVLAEAGNLLDIEDHNIRVSHIAKVYKRRLWAAVIVSIAVVIVLGEVFLEPIAFTVWSLGLISVLGKFRGNESPGEASRLNSAALLTTLIALSVFCFLSGYSEATQKAINPDRSSVIYFRDGSPGVSVDILRARENGILVLLDESTISFYAASDISRVDVKVQKVRSHGLICLIESLKISC